MKSKDKKIEVKEIVEEFSLEVVAGQRGLTNEVYVSEIKRPGIELAGFWKYFSPERVQLLGKTELSFLQELNKSEREQRIKKFMNYDLNCVIVSRDLEIPEILVSKAQKRNIPLLKTKSITTRFLSELTTHLERVLSPEKNIHGVLVDIYGVGVLIMGESGIGKSETAVELLKRGHRLVADDIVNIKKIGEGELIGYSPEESRYFLELRGIGIINIRTLFGAGAVKDTSPINMVITLEPWAEAKRYDRLGLEDNYIEFFNVQVPEKIIPVKPGRNLAMVLEVAAMSGRMKSMGYNAARDYINKTKKNKKILKNP